MFDAAAKKAGKKYHLIPYFIAAHPGTTDEDMMNLALWLKKNRYRADQVQTFLPSPMATATAMYHTGVNPLRGVRRGASDKVEAIKGLRQRRLHKAFLRYHDPDNWPVLREALKEMGRADLIGSRPDQLVPAHQPPGHAARPPARDGPCAAPAGRSASPRRICPWASKSERGWTRLHSVAASAFCRYVEPSLRAERSNPAIEVSPARR